MHRSHRNYCTVPASHIHIVVNWKLTATGTGRAPAGGTRPGLVTHAITGVAVII